MRNTLASLMFMLFASCATSGPVVQVPQPLYADGTSFSMPCAEHGSHTQTIKSHSVGVIYEIASDQGDVQQVPEFLVTQVFQMLGITPNEESGQQTPTDQVFPAPGTVQPSPGDGSGPTGNR